MSCWTDAVEGKWAVDNIDPNAADLASISSLGSMTSLNKAKNSTELEGRLVTIAKTMNKKIDNLTMQVTKANPICKMGIDYPSDSKFKQYDDLAEARKALNSARGDLRKDLGCQVVKLEAQAERKEKKAYSKIVLACFESNPEDFSPKKVEVMTEDRTFQLVGSGRGHRGEVLSGRVF